MKIELKNLGLKFVKEELKWDYKVIDANKKFEFNDSQYYEKIFSAKIADIEKIIPNLLNFLKNSNDFLYIYVKKDDTTKKFKYEITIIKLTNKIEQFVIKTEPVICESPSSIFEKILYNFTIKPEFDEIYFGWSTITVKSKNYFDNFDNFKLKNISVDGYGNIIYNFDLNYSQLNTVSNADKLKLFRMLYPQIFSKLRLDFENNRLDIALFDRAIYFQLKKFNYDNIDELFNEIFENKNNIREIVTILYLVYEKMKTVYDNEIKNLVIKFLNELIELEKFSKI